MAVPKNRLFATATVSLFALVVYLCTGPAYAAGVLEPEDVFNTKYATSARISPDGKWIAYTVSVPRGIDEKAGGRYSELHVVSTKTGESRPFVTGKVNVSGVD